MDQKLVEIFSYSVGLAAVIGLVRLRSVARAYLPFIILMVLAIANEIITTIVIQRGYSNAINNNIYDLFESLLIVWFFYNLGLFEKHRKLALSMVKLLIVFWVMENFYIESIRRFNSYFNILYSLLIVLMSIHMINKLFSTERHGLLRNPSFLVCLGFIGFFTYKLLIEIFWVYGLNASRDFRMEVYRIMAYINLLVNLLYALVALWIPKKQESILP